MGAGQCTGQWEKTTHAMESGMSNVKQTNRIPMIAYLRFALPVRLLGIFVLLTGFQELGCSSDDEGETRAPTGDAAVHADGAGPTGDVGADRPSDTGANPDESNATIDAEPDHGSDATGMDAAVDAPVQAASCTDQLKNDNETDVDCGGDCGPCGDGLGCVLDGDCKSAKCGGDHHCAAPSCTDGIKNGDETDVDCGGACPAKCDLGKTCGVNGDCKGEHCVALACVECVEPTTCPGSDTECQTRTCNANQCGVTNTPTNTRLSEQTAGDCKVRVCDGNGGISTANDNKDVPVDGNPCTEDRCSSGTPSNPPATGTTCTEDGGGHVCDDTGACVECNVPADCGQDTECRTYTCTSHVCTVVNAPQTKITSAQTPGDCHTIHCDGSGGLADPAIDDSDLPVDGKECTEDHCTSGVPSNPAVAPGTNCGTGKQCNGSICGECNFPSDCPGTDSACHHRTCEMNTCGVFNEAAGAAPAQASGDCHTVHCDGSGVASDDVDDTDVPVDTNECTQDVCTGGTPSNPDATGVVCTKAQGGRCAAGAKCVPTFLALRVGDGSAPLTSASTAAFVERRYLDSGAAIVHTISLPTAANGNNRPLTFSGTVVREAIISLSTNGRYASMLGYGTAPGTASVGTTTQPSVVNRVIGRIDSGDNVDTSTALNAAYTKNNVRGAVSVDGTAFWTAGAGDPAGGVWYIALGATGGTQVLKLPHSLRSAFIFGNQLYGATADAPYQGIFSISGGLPTTEGATATSLPGVTVGQPYEFVLFDRDPAVDGPDTLYVADERNPADGGGILKWTFDGLTWSLVSTFTLDDAGATLGVGMRGVAGAASDSAITLVATTANGPPNRIFMYVDDGGTPNPKPTLLATAAANTIYRSVSLAP
jgi:hypothetical protein